MVRYTKHIAIRTRTHKYVIKMEGGWNNDPVRTISVDPSEFYDLREDPYEINNLASTAASQQGPARNLRSLLVEWNNETPWL